jgi:hypothetical protein
LRRRVPREFAWRDIVEAGSRHPSGPFGAVEDFVIMARDRYHYPVTIYVLTVGCAVGLACVALGIADGWVLIAAGATVIVASLVLLHVILDRRRVGEGLGPLPLHGAKPQRRGL